MSTSYIQPIDLDFYVEGFVGQYYGADSSGTLKCIADMAKHFNKANEYLRGIEQIGTVPIGTGLDGNYPESVKELQSKRQIYSKLVSSHAMAWGDNTPSWVQEFKLDYEKIEQDIYDGNLIFDSQLSNADIGINPPSIATRVGLATFFNSFNMSNMPFTGEDFPRKYRVEIDGTSNGHEIGKSTFKVSRDNGISFYSSLVVTSTTWTDVENSILVRWENHATTGTQKQTAIGDSWVFDTTPINTKGIVKNNTVKVSYIRRG